MTLEGNAPKALEVVFWDIQHGNAAYVRTPSGKHIAIDLGRGSLGSGGDAFSPLSYLRDRWHVARLDAAIISHPHRDHLNDIENFDKLDPRILLRPKHLTADDIRAGNPPGSNRVLDQYFEIDRRYSGTVSAAESPFDEQNSGGVTINWFVPTQADRSNLNNHSLVVVLAYATSTILIPGDNEAESWQELLAQSAFRQAIGSTDIMLAAHHGRREGYSEHLFKVIAPKLIVVSDGPAGDTSITSTYAAKAAGWKVHHRQGGSDQRKVVTTRSDGAIRVSMGYNEDRSAYLMVTSN